MKTPLRHTRYDRVFQLLDGDGDGVVRAVDGDVSVDKLLTEFGVPGDSPKAVRLRDHLAAMFEDFLGPDFRDRAGTREEFHAYMRGHPDRLERMVEVTTGAEFDVADHDDDGVLDRPGVHRMWRAFELTPQDAEAAFEYMDTDRDGRVTRADYVGMWLDFLLVDDEDSPVAKVAGQEGGAGGGHGRP
ncbi:EF-hand domain-containing protein [Actinosynnema sp. NPDC020468]|uniref:EF-hand domain-containing protein n=1 Tax=Actinosynnema sp. NPDC020468 TaxID=3154488 RepID=UPI0033D08DA6